MAKWEIPSRSGPTAGLWWRYMPGVTIEVPWPTGHIVVESGHPRWDWALGATLQQVFSSDPNDHYRPWMEQHVGRQGWDWNWRIGKITSTPGPAQDTLIIKFRRGREKYATIAALRWQ